MLQFRWPPTRPADWEPWLSGSGDFEVMIPPPAPLSLSWNDGEESEVCEKETDLYTYPPGKHIPKNGILKMIFLFPRWDMLIAWRVYHHISHDMWIEDDGSVCVCVWRGKKNPSWNLNLGDIHTDVSENRGTPKSSILRGFSIYKPSILG